MVAPSLTPVPSALESRIRPGVDGRDPAGDRGQRLLGRGHVRGVERPGDLQRDHAGPGRRVARRTRRGLSCGARGDDLPGAVAVGRVQPGRLDRGHHLVGVAAEHGAHAGRLQRAGGGHLAAADRREGDRRLGGQHAGERGGADLTDAVPGDHADIGQGQVLGRRERGRDEQGLGLGGVPDLVGVGHRAEVDQVDAGGHGPPAQPGLGAADGEPIGEETGLL